jgi:hypothetical protein
MPYFLPELLKSAVKIIEQIYILNVTIYQIKEYDRNYNGRDLCQTE